MRRALLHTQSDKCMLTERRKWNREETIIAFNLYCKLPFSQCTSTNPTIIRIAAALNRTPSALSMKIGNLASLDPDLKKQGFTGLVNGSRLDEEIWNEFKDDWSGLAFESENALADLESRILDDTSGAGTVDNLFLPPGMDKRALLKVRINQSFFRSTILATYGYKCCITGMTADQLLVASHIIPWAERVECRTDPRNGLLLNAFHDKAFDKGLITVTTDYKVKVSKHAANFLPSTIIEEWLVKYDGEPIALPAKFSPSKDYLKWHSENIFKN